MTGQCTFTCTCLSTCSYNNGVQIWGAQYSATNTPIPSRLNTSLIPSHNDEEHRVKQIMTSEQALELTWDQMWAQTSSELTLKLTSEQTSEQTSLEAKLEQMLHGLTSKQTSSELTGIKT